MNIDSAYSVAQSALNDNMSKMNEIAHNIANSDGTSLDLISDMTNATITQRSYEANIKTIKTLDEMFEAIIGMR